MRGFPEGCSRAFFGGCCSNPTAKPWGKLAPTAPVFAGPAQVPGGAPGRVALAAEREPPVGPITPFMGPLEGRGPDLAFCKTFH